MEHPPTDASASPDNGLISDSTGFILFDNSLVWDLRAIILSLIPLSALGRAARCCRAWYVHLCKDQLWVAWIRAHYGISGFVGAENPSWSRLFAAAVREHYAFRLWNTRNLSPTSIVRTTEQSRVAFQWSIVEYLVRPKVLASSVRYML